MSTFVEVRTDGFAKNVNTIADSASIYGTSARRPLRGIEIKDDTYATLRVMNDDGTSISLVDAGSNRIASDTDDKMQTGSTQSAARGGRSNNYTNFIIQGVQDVREEKMQIMETFGDSYLFFFGERPRLLQVSGLLFNTLDFNWRTEFWINYENILRGTKLVQRNARIYLHWDDVIVEGYMLGATARDDAEMPYHVPFQFTLFVTNHTYVSAYVVGDRRFPGWDTAYESQIEGIVDPSATSFKDTLLNADRLKEAGKQLGRLGTSIALTGAGAALAGLKSKGSLSGLKDGFTGVSSGLLKNALGIGLQNAGNYLLDVIDEYYRNQTMAVPKRKLPLRTFISDNYDEYLPEARDYEPAFDEGAILRKKLFTKTMDTLFKVEKAAFQALALYSDPSTLGDSANLGLVKEFHAMAVMPDPSPKVTFADIAASPNSAIINGPKITNFDQPAIK